MYKVAKFVIPLQGMKKDEAKRDKARIEAKAIKSKQRAIQDEYIKAIPESDINPNGKEDFDSVLKALLDSPPTKRK